MPQISTGKKNDFLCNSFKDYHLGVKRIIFYVICLLEGAVSKLAPD
jgi:hypothetical protein